MDPVERRFTPWLDVVAEAVRHPCGGFPHRMFMRLLAETFDESVGWNSFGLDGQSVIEVHDAAPGWPPDDLVDAWLRNAHAHPLLRWLMFTGDQSPMTIGRVPDQLVTRQGRQGVSELLAPYGLEEQLSITCTLDPGRVRAFVISRSGSDFSDEDLAVARRLQPLFALIARQSDVLEGCRPATIDVDLTGRELAILRLLDHGLTAAAIGHRLTISPRTVHKHLENVYRKLGVRDRLMASRVAHETGLLGSPSKPETTPRLTPRRGRAVARDDTLLAAGH
jgi:DNA-binding CsgD family transcriptional regulator